MIDRFSGMYSFLSNFYPAMVHWQGVQYPSVEHAFQAAKTTNPEMREAIRNAPTATDAKRLGRSVALRPRWDYIRLPIMNSLLRRKFTNRDLRRRLLQTNPHTLVEGNNWGDRFWGVCDGVGENHLGKLLMQLREDLLEEDHVLQDV